MTLLFFGENGWRRKGLELAHHVCGHRLDRPARLLFLCLSLNANGNDGQDGGSDNNRYGQDEKFGFHFLPSGKIGGAVIG